MDGILKALNAPRRREILRSIWNEEKTAGDIWRVHSDITFGAVSQHLRVLYEAGLVSSRSEGVQHFYTAKKEQLGPFKEWLEQMWDTALYRLKVQAELEQARRGPQPGKRRKRR